jgi:hypothetical protein
MRVAGSQSVRVTVFQSDRPKAQNPEDPVNPVGELPSFLEALSPSCPVTLWPRGPVSL